VRCTDAAGTLVKSKPCAAAVAGERSSPAGRRRLLGDGVHAAPGRQIWFADTGLRTPMDPPKINDCVGAPADGRGKC
jgi:hypothetical protein